MWVATTSGFYSVVAHRFEEDTVIIRCRVKQDLLNLEPFLPGIKKEVYTDLSADYPYRANVPAGAWALAMARMSTEIDYDNFKNAVADRQGKKRANIYMGVWSHLLKLEPRAISRRFQHWWEDSTVKYPPLPGFENRKRCSGCGVTLFATEEPDGVCADCISAPAKPQPKRRRAKGSKTTSKKKGAKR